MLTETKTCYDEVLGEQFDIKQFEQKWFSVIIAAGHFVVRAFALDEAILKSEVYADDLGSANVRIGHGLPLAMTISDEASRFYDGVWFEGKPDVTLISFSQDTSHLLPEIMPVLETTSHNAAQLNLPFA